MSTLNLTSAAWHRLLPLIAATGLTSLVLGLSPSMLEGYDWLRMHFFHKEHFRAAFRAGTLPLWNPTISLGRPFLADIETATLYPPNLFYAFGLASGLIANLVFHFWLLIVGMLKLGKILGSREAASWLSALGFALGAPLLGRLQSGQLQVFCALCWIPVLLACGHTMSHRPGPRATVGLASSLALLFLAGSPPMFWIGLWTLAAWMAGSMIASFPPHPWRVVGWGALAGVLAAGITAAQALPFLELISEGNRTGLPSTYALTYSMAAESWWSLLRSKAPTSYHYWEYNLYLGLPLAALALLSLPWMRQGNARIWLILASLFAILALGAATPVLPVLVEYVPGWDTLRYPSRYAIITALGLCLLAGCGLEQGLRWWKTRWPHAMRFGTGLALVLIALNCADAIRAGLERAQRYSAPIPAIREGEIAAHLHSAGKIGSPQPPPRIIAPPWIVRENSGLIHNYSTVSGFANPTLRRVWLDIHRRLGLTPDPLDPVNLPMTAYTVPAEAYDGLDLAAFWDATTAAFVLLESKGSRVWLSAGGKAEIRSFANEHIVIDVESTSSQRLILSEPWYPGWQARLNGRSVSVQPAEGWMRSVEVPAGNYRIEFSYHSRWLALGATLSFLSIMIVGGLWWRREPALMIGDS